MVDVTIYDVVYDSAKMLPASMEINISVFI